MDRAKLKEVNINGETYKYLDFYMDYGYGEEEPISGYHSLPVITKGSRDNNIRCVWTWNGDLENPTLKPSIKTKHRTRDKTIIMHCWVTDGKTQFLSDSEIPNKGKTVELLSLNQWDNMEE